MNRSYRDLLLSMMVPVTPEQDRACRYLESRGLIFLVDFGLLNAEEKAREELRRELPQGRPS